MIVPEAFRKSVEHRTLWATMSYLVEHDPAGPVVKGAHDREVAKAAVDRHRTVLEERAADEFRAYFREERAHVVKSIEEGLVAPRGVIGELAPDLRETYERAWAASARAWGEWAVKKSALVAKATDYGTPIDAWLRKNAGKRITGITERSRKLIAAQIAEGQAQGETLRQIARRIDKFYLEDVIPNRSAVIARTEVGGATNWMQDWIAHDSGVPMEKEWLSLRDDRVRPDHADANGQVQPLDEPFVVGGDEMMYPHDESLGAGPEEIVNCRCSVLHHVVEEQPRHKAAAPSPAEFARDVLGVESADVAVALAYAKGVFGEADEWTHARRVLMKHVSRLRRAAQVEKFDPTELRDKLGRWAAEGGGRFDGVQESGIPGRPGLALVTDHQTGSTGAIRLDDVTRERVHAKLQEIRDRFAAVEKYDPNEPRDERGRWTDGWSEGESDAGVVPVYSAEGQRKAEAARRFKNGDAVRYVGGSKVALNPGEHLTVRGVWGMNEKAGNIYYHVQTGNGRKMTLSDKFFRAPLPGETPAEPAAAPAKPAKPAPAPSPSPTPAPSPIPSPAPAPMPPRPKRRRSLTTSTPAPEPPYTGPRPRSTRGRTAPP